MTSSENVAANRDVFRLTDMYRKGRKLDREQMVAKSLFVPCFHRIFTSLFSFFSTTDYIINTGMTIKISGGQSDEERQRGG